MDILRRIIHRTKLWIGCLVSANPRYFWSVISMYIITFIIMLPWLCSDWAYSMYMSEAWSREQLGEMVLDKNQQRLVLASNYIARLDFAATLRSYADMLNVDDVDIAIGVITVKRQSSYKDDIGYLTQVMARLDAVYKDDTSFAKKALFICNVHAGPGKHREADKLSFYFPVSTRFPDGDTASVILDHFEKEKQDYVYCMEEAMNYRPRYIMLVEDDALPRYDMLTVVNYTLDNHVERTWRGDTQTDNRHKWAYVKLYYPERWQGYSFEVRPLFELLALAAVGGSVFVSVLLFCFSGRSHKSCHVMRTRYVAFVLGAVYVTLFAVFVGRQYMIGMRRLSAMLYSVVPAPDCCSPSVLYPSHIVPDILDHLHNSRCTSNNPLDIALDQFVTSRNYEKYLVEPNLFSHIGYISTIKGPSSNPAMFLY